MNKMQRRDAIIAMAASSLAVSSVSSTGCSSELVDQRVAEMPTETLAESQIALRGFQIVAFMVGKRLVTLPHPAVRVLGVALLTSGAVTFLVVEYLDIELKKRRVREAIDEQERIAIESELAVEFQTENGFTEKVALGPNQYEYPEQDPEIPTNTDDQTKPDNSIQGVEFDR